MDLEKQTIGEIDVEFYSLFPSSTAPTKSHNFLRWDHNPNQNRIIPYK